MDGQNVAVEFHWAHGNHSQLPALAAELIARRVSVLVAVGGGPSARAEKAATSIMPDCLFDRADPVEFVESVNRPGGNATGYTMLSGQLEAKRLGLLQELIPNVDVYGSLLNPAMHLLEVSCRSLSRLPVRLGKCIVAAHARNDRDLDTALLALSREQIGALVVTSDAYFDTRRLRSLHSWPNTGSPRSFNFRDYVVDGGS